MGSSDWDDTALYLWDAWVACTNGAEVGVDRLRSGRWRDGWRGTVDGAIELTLLVRSLVDNAIEAMGGGGALMVRTIEEGGAAVLEVEDEGGGIEGEDAAALAPFGSTKAGHVELGLNVAKRIAERHGGKLAIERRERTKRSTNSAVKSADVATAASVSARCASTRFSRIARRPATAEASDTTQSAASTSARLAFVVSSSPGSGCPPSPGARAARAPSRRRW